ncbi:hypothetical protein [Flavobacterium sp.]|uniref:hypothetical protein n=1 Tax=Flavobacterium sp. TaxID=239 RepID=UPI00403324DA
MAERKDTEILKNAQTLWKALTATAQMHKICYDKELLTGNESAAGLYTNLGIADPGPDFLDDLKTYDISVEQLLIAFFRTLQPYAQMMSGLCAFFQRHAIKETNNYLRIKFDFQDGGLENLEFDLEHFREQLDKFRNAQETVSYFFLNQNAIWGMLQILSKDYTEISEAPWINKWEQDFNRGIWSAVDLPLTGHNVLDANLSKVYDVYRSFTYAANAFGITQKNAPDFFNYNDSREDEYDIYPTDWTVHRLATATHDRWPVTFLRRLFYRLESLQGLSHTQRDGDSVIWAEQIAAFFEKHGVHAQKQIDLVQELQDILKLPIWQKRYELYSVWILALMDEVLLNYPGYTVHHAEGQLIIKFKATKLATFETEIGRTELWTEVRMPINDPVGHSRKANIQPDYTFFKNAGETAVASNGLVVVEVKQYEKPNTRIFKDALIDYLRGVENAHVFLVNYGTLRPAMEVSNPERCTALGQVYPNTPTAEIFQEKLRNELPRLLLPSLDNKVTEFTDQDWLALREGYDRIFVDISYSLNLESYKKFLKTMLKWSIEGNAVGQVVAIDEDIRREWMGPTESDIESLLSLPFDRGTDLGNKIQGDHVLVITDADGEQQLLLSNQVKSLHIVCYAENEPVTFKRIINSPVRIRKFVKKNL